MNANQVRFRSLLRISALGHCPRRFAYYALEGKQAEKPAKVKPVFTDGHYHEYDIKRRMAEEGVIFECGITRAAEVEAELFPGCPVVGHIDGSIQVPSTVSERWLVPGRHLSEDKSMSGGPYWRFVKGGYEVAFPSYYAQIQGYLHAKFLRWSPMLDEDAKISELLHTLYADLAWAEDWVEGDTLFVLPETALISAKNKENGNIWGELIRPDDDYFESMGRRWETADALVAQGSLPDRLHESPENYECRECPAMKECWASEVVEYKSLDTEDAREAARLLTIGKALEKAADKIVTYAEGYLDPEIPGKYEVEGVKINKFATSRNKWDHSALERMLTPQQLEEVKISAPGFTVRRDAPALTAEEFRDLLRGLSNGKGGELLSLGGDSAEG
jgi:hypothetical protein